MKLVKEHIIFEKFSEDSDPIEDMGIGIYQFWQKEKQRLWKVPFGNIMKQYFPEWKCRPGTQPYMIAYTLCDILRFLAEKYKPQNAFNKACEKDDLGNEFNLTQEERNYLAEVLKEHFHVSIDPYKKKKSRKSVNEKFTEDSDPIYDMGIGFKKQIDDWIKTTDAYEKFGYTNEEDKLWICAVHNKYNFVKYLLEHGHKKNISRHEDHAIKWAARCGYVRVVKILLDAGAKTKFINDVLLSWARVHNNERIIKIIKNHEKNQKIKKINEKFTEDSDPVHDMGIGLTYEKIKENITRDLFGCRIQTDIQLLLGCMILKKYHYVEYLLKNKVLNLKQIQEAYRLATGILSPKVLGLFKEYIKKYYLKKSVNEKFTEDSDPIHDMGIGVKVHRDFTSEKEFYKFLIDVVIPYLIGPIPENILSSEDGIIRHDIYKKINAYLDKYITYNGRNAASTAFSHNSYWNYGLKDILKKKGFKT